MRGNGPDKDILSKFVASLDVNDVIICAKFQSEILGTQNLRG